MDPSVGKRMGVDAEVIELLNAFKGDSKKPFSIEHFFLDDDVLDRLLDAYPYKGAKFGRQDEMWQSTHLNFCLENGLEWPRDFYYLKGYRHIPPA